MPNIPHKPDNRAAWAWGLQILVGCLLGAYVVAFFAQPSLFGFRGEDGEPLPRVVDLSLVFLWEAMVAGMTGHGRYQVGIVDRLPILLAGLAWLVVAWRLGAWMLQRVVCAPRLTGAERLALSVLAGLAALSTLTLCVGFAGGLGTRWPLLWLLLLALAVTIRLPVGRRAPEATDGSEAGLTNADAEPMANSTLGVWAGRLVPVSTMLLGVIYLLGSLVTPFEFDVVEYHLQAPKEFYQAGRVAFNAHNVYANMPLGAEMHSLAAMTLLSGDAAWWWGGLFGKFLIGCYSLLAAVLLGGFVARQLGNWYGWAAAGLLLSAPGNLHVASAGLIDSVVGAYVLGMLVMLTCLWRRPERGLGPVFACSLFAGAAAACKYTGFVLGVVPAILAISYIGWRHRSTGLRRWSAVGLFLAGLCCTCLPWLAKNALETGNPVYPLAAGLFGGGNLTPAQLERWRTAHQVPQVAGSAYGPAAIGESLKQLFLASNFLSPTLLALAAVAVVAFLVRRERLPWWLGGWLVMGAWILLVWWTATHRIDRFWLPILPIYAAAAAIGVRLLSRRVSAGLAAGLVLLSVFYAGFVGVAGALGDNRFFVRLDELRTDAGDEELPGRLAPTTKWINDHVGPEQTVLLIGEARVFDFEPPIVYATCFNQNPAEAWLAGRSPAEQRAALEQAGVAYLLVHWGELARYRSAGNYGFSTWPQRADIDGLIQQGVAERVDWPFPAERAELLRITH